MGDHYIIKYSQREQEHEAFIDFWVNKGREQARVEILNHFMGYYLIVNYPLSTGIRVNTQYKDGTEDGTLYMTDSSWGKIENATKAARKISKDFELADSISIDFIISADEPYLRCLSPFYPGDLTDKGIPITDTREKLDIKMKKGSQPSDAELFERSLEAEKRLKKRLVGKVSTAAKKMEPLSAIEV